MGERSPIWDTEAKGVICGLSLIHTRGHIYRAFLEAVAYSLRHSMECTGVDVGKSILLAGGVTKSKLWRQIFADVTGHEVICPQMDAEANLGDVILAGIGTGTLTYDDVKKWQVLEQPIKPNQENYKVYSQYYQSYRSIYDSLKEDMAKMSELVSLDY